jgi:hypothetical protein
MSVIEADAGSMQPDGSIHLKYGWWRATPGISESRADA